MDLFSLQYIIQATVNIKGKKKKCHYILIVWFALSFSYFN